MWRAFCFCTLTLLLVSGPAVLQAAAIHKWVDEKGVTHYSDEPPPTAAVDSTQLDITTGKARDAEGAAASAEEDYYSIANQWQRMQREQALRQQREIERAAIQADHAQAQASQAQQYYRYDDDYRRGRYVIAYPYRYKKHRKHRRHSGNHQMWPTHTRPSRPKSAGGFPSVVN